MHSDKPLAFILWRGTPDSKSRLSAEIGKNQAIKVAIRVLSNVVDVCKRSKLFPRIYLVTSGETPKDLDIEIFRDEGRGIDRAVDAICNQFRQPKLILMGDLLDVNYDALQQSVEQLKEHDFIIVPSQDKGTAILGLRTGVKPHTRYGKLSSLRTSKSLQKQGYSGIVLPFIIHDLDSLDDIIQGEGKTLNSLLNDI